MPYFILQFSLSEKSEFFLIEQVAKEQRANLALFLAIIYIIALAIKYSAFKYKVIRIIMGKEQVSGKFYGFCILNCVVFSIFIILYYIFILLIRWIVKEEFWTQYVLFISIFLFFAAYIVINLYQALKYRGVIGKFRSVISGRQVIFFLLFLFQALIIWLIYSVFWTIAYISNSSVELNSVMVVVVTLTLILFNSVIGFSFASYLKGYRVSVELVPGIQ